MAIRGDQLREHILWVAKDVFLEMGFERASMDEIATRAKASKRSLYAHFESKEKLYLEVIELVRGLFLGKLRMPEDYSEDVEEALVLFCARYLELLLYDRSILMCRVSIAETARFPEGSARYFDVVFTEFENRLVAHMIDALHLAPDDAVAAGQRLMGQVLYPRFQRALFGIDVLPDCFDDHAVAPGFDLVPIRAAVKALLRSLERGESEPAPVVHSNP